jgi:predicted ribosomally synthesized peptide with SipW-like signal peptide
VTVGRRILLSLVVVGVLGIVAGGGTYSSFSEVTQNDNNLFVAGSVSLGDNDGGSAVVSLSNAKPADSSTGCVTVTYSGSLPANVRLYGATTGTGLDQYVNLVVTRGTKSNATFDCSTFSPDATNYIGSGAGVVYSGTLQAFPDNFSGGIVDPTSGSPESWTTSEAHTYRIQVTLQNNAAAQGLNASQTFTWEARNQ